MRSRICESEVENFLLLKHVKCLLFNKQDKTELCKQKMTVTSVAVATTKFLFAICDCTIDNDVSTGDFSLVLGTLYVCEHVHVRSHGSPGMDCIRRICMAYCKEIQLWCRKTRTQSDSSVLKDF